MEHLNHCVILGRLVLVFLNAVSPLNKGHNSNNDHNHSFCILGGDLVLIKYFPGTVSFNLSNDSIK